jgi:hypothetical protein
MKISLILNGISSLIFIFCIVAGCFLFGEYHVLENTIRGSAFLLIGSLGLISQLLAFNLKNKQ